MLPARGVLFHGVFENNQQPRLIGAISLGSQKNTPQQIRPRPLIGCMMQTSLNFPEKMREWISSFDPAYDTMEKALNLI